MSLHVSSAMSSPTTERVDTEVILLTGSSGCLGFHTLKLLITEDKTSSEIRCLDLHPQDEVMRGCIDEALEKHNINSTNKKRIKYYEGDVRDVNLVERVTEGVNCIIHCAAKIDIWTENSDQDESELESINVGATENLLKAAVRFGVHKFIHVSSFEAYAGYYTVYYATETTMPETDYLIFGASAKTKKLAEQRVKQYSNNKLTKVISAGKDSLNAIVVRFPPIYGEYDHYYISKILSVTKFFGGKLRRWSNIWIRQQPIYAGNAAWSLIKAKHRMELDMSISGEEFHVTDDTPIQDPFDFVQPFVEAKGMSLTKNSFYFLPVWLLMVLFFTLRKYIAFFDVFGLFSKRNSRLSAAMEEDRRRQNPNLESIPKANTQPKHWYEIVTPQVFAFMCVSNFLNRTKASLRLNYEPLVCFEESQKLSIEWYKNNVHL